ncbi:ectonucleoside triphosphate diphosphohydrolase 5-like isoform X2 [Adelges cooleyi]|uniref:ectonucleoside triphosphate diphosphohydrolase 5-like isoform X2 n=1 Tax=Adelges cooleyi TaxID=133065 RepID=UPI00218080FC|nr:ectonucleoside triphosphate diphosphohydrolase 5-like isoform X2 [Adelges cooleyi]
MDVKEDDGYTNDKQKPNVNQNKFVVYSIFAVVLILLYSYYTIYYTYRVEESPLKVPLLKPKYAVIIDAGSTGSRVLALSFKSTPSGGLTLEDELFVQVKPGVSSFADDPKKASESVDQLLAKALNFVPKQYWKDTPLAMRATAGLRLLPVEKADGLLNEIRHLFDRSPFYTNKNSVAIMDGIDEGLFSWFTVNFLLDRLNGKLTHTVAALDLGGGSIQITFIPSDSTQIKQKLPEFITEYSIMNQKVNLYSHSYLGLGLMAARKSVFTSYGDEINVTSPCVSEAAKGTPYKFAGKTYHVTGASSKNGTAIDYNKCKNIIERVVEAIDTDKPKDLLTQPIIAFSYFYDRAQDADLVGEEGGTVTVNKFYAAAIKECSKSDYNELRPFKCLDLIYISVLLEQGFGLPGDEPITLLNTIDGHEISWALGAAYHILQNGL